MRKNTLQVTTAFMLGAKCGKLGDSISTDGRTIFSYRTPIAKRTDDLSVIRLSYDKYSVTTSRQQSEIKQILQSTLTSTLITNL